MLGNLNPCYASAARTQESLQAWPLWILRTDRNYIPLALVLERLQIRLILTASVALGRPSAPDCEAIAVDPNSCFMPYWCRKQCVFFRGLDSYFLSLYQPSHATS